MGDVTNLNKDHYPLYGVVLVAGAALAVWAGLPSAFLLFLACPLMMFFMMKGMGGMRGNARDQPTTSTTKVPVEEPKRL